MSGGDVGRVILVGAGPGDPGLLTERGHAALMAADDVVYDALISERMIASCSGRRHFVGKRAGMQTLPQAEIEALLVQLARAGRNVCRLKGGDPFLFGRGGEEVEALERAGIEYQVIPGVTAAIGAAAYCGMALTYRAHSSSVAFCTGHAEPIPVPAVDTIVYYMGAASLAQIAEAVLTAGWSSSTLVQIVQDATLPQQQSTMSDLGKIQAGEVAAASPSIIVIGAAVAAASARGGWYTRRPKVLVTGLRAEPFASMGEVIHTPLLVTRAVADRGMIRCALGRLSEIDHIAFTSRTAVNYFMRNLLEANLDTRALAGCTIGAVGDKTAAALASFALRADLIGDGSGAEELLAAYKAAGVCGARILVPSSDLTRTTLAEGLRAAGNRVEVLTIYVTMPRSDPVREELSGIAQVAFSSPSGVDAFCTLYGEQLPADLQIVALGELTARAAKEAYPHHTVCLLSG